MAKIIWEELGTQKANPSNDKEILEMKNILNSVKFAVRKLVRIDELSEGELEKLYHLYKKWEDIQGETLLEGELVRYLGNLYNVLKEHEVKKDYNPEDTNYLYNLATPNEVIPEWFAVRGYQDSIVRVKGYKMIYEGKIYISKIDGNSAEPTKDEPYNRYWEEEQI